MEAVRHDPEYEEIVIALVSISASREVGLQLGVTAASHIVGFGGRKHVVGRSIASPSDDFRVITNLIAFDQDRAVKRTGCQLIICSRGHEVGPWQACTLLDRQGAVLATWEVAS
jgi:PII-like signaling protein